MLSKMARSVLPVYAMNRRRCGKVGTHVILVNMIAFIHIAASILNAWTSPSLCQLVGCLHCSHTSDVVALKCWELNNSSAGLSSLVPGGFAFQTSLLSLYTARNAVGAQESWWCAGEGRRANEPWCHVAQVHGPRC